MIGFKAIKKAEDDNSLIFRFYEFEGGDSQVRLVFPEMALSAVETNLMEKEERPVELAKSGREITMPIGHHEIKSLKVAFQNVAGSLPPRRI